jgi:hypothetical protein
MNGEALDVTLQYILPIYISLTQMAVFQCLVVDVVSEKESKMKEIMHIYGITEKLYWTAWLLCYGIYAVACIAIMLWVLTSYSHVFDQ